MKNDACSVWDPLTSTNKIIHRIDLPTTFENHISNDLARRDFEKNATRTSKSSAMREDVEMMIRFRKARLEHNGSILSISKPKLRAVA